MMEKNAKIYVAGHRGMVGSAIVRELQRQGYTNIITRTHKELDLCRQQDVEDFFAAEKAGVRLSGSGQGGRHRGQFQEALADFMYYNMTLEMNAIHCRLAATAAKSWNSWALPASTPAWRPSPCRKAAC